MMRKSHESPFHITSYLCGEAFDQAASHTDGGQWHRALNTLLTASFFSCRISLIKQIYIYMYFLLYPQWDGAVSLNPAKVPYIMISSNGSVLVSEITVAPEVLNIWMNSRFGANVDVFHPSDFIIIHFIYTSTYFKTISELKERIAIYIYTYIYTVNAEWLKFK